MDGSIKLKHVRKFSDNNVEKLYLHHLVSEKKSHNFTCFVIAMALNALAQTIGHVLWWTDFTFHDESKRLVGANLTSMKMVMEKANKDIQAHENQNSLFVAFVMVCNGIGVLSVIMMLQNKKITHSPLCPPIAVFIWTALILFPIAVRSDNLPLRVGLGWIMLEIFLIWITLPVGFSVAFLYTLGIGISHTLIVAWKGRHQPMFVNQLIANVILLVTTNLLGIMAFYFNDKRQRLAFLDTRQSLEVKEAMDAATKEQKRLLFSVLPRHLADTMAKDMESAANESGGEVGAFKKIYMNRHEPVSILFADIVGFTAMSAAIGSASKLVEILNDLFTTFDSLSEKHQQVRIKILGDCYYCICGAPEEQPLHAVLSVYMGLAVVEAIKEIQRRTNTDVDMRVGIHTGAVLAGVLGQKQWQFDVYSKDVTLANKMESSGTPGKVHISNTTLSFLSGEFEVEPGDGDSHEEALRMAGIKTFFITKVLKPYNSGGFQADGQNQTGINMNDDSYGNRLEAHLESQHGMFSTQTNMITLQFKDKEKEEEYAELKDPSSGQSFLGLACSLCAITSASIFAISFNIIGFTVGSIGFVLIALIGTFIVTERSEVTNKPAIRGVLVAVSVLGMVAANFSFMIPCFSAANLKLSNSTVLKNRTEIVQGWSNLNCYFPAYFSMFIALSLFALTIMSNTASWVKILASSFVTAVVAAAINFGPLQKSLIFSEVFSFPNGFDLVLESAQSSLFLLFIFVLLCLLNRQLEISSRSLFLQKYNVIHLRDQADQLRQRNEALMCNILPQHVAEHFLDKTQNHDILYSHNYQEVGIIFASMPNFADFYTEDSVNNQGLECLRFLNEVISDFDAILDYSKFKDQIIKIKTIGSTYMAASGLNPHIQIEEGVTQRERWRHLALLVEFVYEMKSVLDRINKESYNQFVLRIGVNHGPVTAGVIGATKPAYDVWGNTVNVSSRMESTGKAGLMQLTEDCYKILRVYGYQFEQRGFVAVKGKGNLLTYFLIGRGKELSDEAVAELEKGESKDSTTMPPAEVN